MANGWMAVRNADTTAYGVKVANDIDYSEYYNNETYTPPRPLKNNESS